VLWIEFMPAVFERFGWQHYQKIYDKLFFAIIAFGIVLPTMHQSSLGSVIIVAGEKISPLWQTTWIPFFFLTSAIIMGFAILIFEGCLTALGLQHPIEKDLFQRLSLVLRGVLVAYLLVRLADLIYRGALGLAFAGDVQGNMFLVETLLFAAPLVILSHPSWRDSARGLFLAAVCLVFAGAVLRFNALLVGFNAPAGYQYFPSAIEILLSLGMFAIEVAGFIVIVKLFPVLPRHEPAPQQSATVAGNVAKAV